MLSTVPFKGLCVTPNDERISGLHLGKVKESKTHRVARFTCALCEYTLYSSAV